MIVLTAAEAAKVRGVSPTVGYAALEPRPLSDGKLCLPERVLSDPAHADVAAFLATRSTVESVTYASVAQVASYAYPKWHETGIRRKRPYYGEIAPTGDATGTVSTVNTLTGLRSSIRSITADRTTRVDPVSPTIYAVNGNLRTPINRSNYTLQGDFRSIAFKDHCLDIDGGDNIVICDLVSKPGADLPGATLEDRDGMRIGHAGLPITNVLLEHCEFSLSVDELLSIIGGSGPYARNVLFRYCAFYEPFENAGHPEGFHAFATLVYNWHTNIVFDRCFWSSAAMRHPMIGNCRGILTQNCLINYRGKASGHGGTGHYSTAATVESDMGTTSIVRGNLYWPHPGYDRDRAWTFNKIGPGSFIHLVEAGDEDSETYPNHFYNPSTLDFSDDPVTRADHLTLVGGATKASAINYDPFIPEDYGALETDTPEKRETMFWDVFLKAGACKRDENGDIIPGVHNKQLYDCKTRLRLNGGFRGITLANIATWYGSDLSVGGTLGKINDEAPQLEAA